MDFVDGVFLGRRGGADAVVGFVAGGTETSLVAGEVTQIVFAERAGVADQAVSAGAGVFGGVGVVWSGVEFPGGCEEFLTHGIQVAGFHAADAAHAPLAVDEVFSEETLNGVVGLEGVEDGVLEVGVFGVGFADGVDDIVGGEEAVGLGVPGGAGLAFGGAGSGGLSGVGPVGGELLFRDHGCLLLRLRRARAGRGRANMVGVARRLYG
ncbi:MAG: hypothetical protein R2729_29355 [Bryobacteraceae bacterium]